MAVDRLTIYLDAKTLAETNRKLRRLSNIEREAVVAQAVKEGAQIISRQTRKNVATLLKKRTGNLYRSVSVLTRKKIGVAYAGFKRGKGGGSHAIFFEHGTKDRYTKAGAYRGKVKAYELQKRSVDKKADKVLQTMLGSIEKSINRIINRDN